MSSSDGNPSLTSYHSDHPFRHREDQVYVPWTTKELRMVLWTGMGQGKEPLAQLACKSHLQPEGFAGYHLETWCSISCLWIVNSHLCHPMPKPGDLETQQHAQSPQGQLCSLALSSAGPQQREPGNDWTCPPVPARLDCLGSPHEDVKGCVGSTHPKWGSPGLSPRLDSSPQASHKQQGFLEHTLLPKLVALPSGIPRCPDCTLAMHLPRAAQSGLLWTSGHKATRLERSVHHTHTHTQPKSTVGPASIAARASIRVRQLCPALVRQCAQYVMDSRMQPDALTYETTNHGPQLCAAARW